MKNRVFVLTNIIYTHALIVKFYLGISTLDISCYFCDPFQIERKLLMDVIHINLN